MYLKKFKRTGTERVDLTWDDGHAGQVSLQTLRDACPCAGCTGETVLLHHYAPVPEADPSPLKYSLAGASTVGSYAMQLQWGDGHSTGIYTWEHLRSLCECPKCLLKRRTP
jgi:DUF971 family protein